MNQFTPVTLSDNSSPVNFLTLLRMDGDDVNSGQDVRVVLSKFNRNETLIQMSAPRVRCDKIVQPYAGCRFFNYPAVFALSLSDPDVDEAAKHALDAQLMLPGKLGYWNEATGERGKPLTRLTDARKQGESRAISRRLCKERFPEKPEGTDCDEYPFASTWQGASFVQPEEVSVRYITSADNQLAGSRLGTFLAKDARVLDGEEFWVEIRD